MKNAQYYIKHLQLEQHPEGGYFKETYRSKENVINRNGVERSASTGIYFLITSEFYSAFHKIESDEMWHYHDGAALSVYIITENGELEILKIGNDIENGEQLQGVVPAGCWFASKVAISNSFSLVGCTVAPGFDFDDFVLAERKELIQEFPKHKEIITDLTRD
ncbi:MAG: cupin domain-containing protein [Vicingaceae bacterium]|nr:cupin domain-containing protein [Vicingaceae bacterium]